MLGEIPLLVSCLIAIGFPHSKKRSFVLAIALTIFTYEINCMNGHDPNEANSNLLQLSDLISTQIQLIGKAQDVSLRTSSSQASNRQLMECYIHDITLGLEQLRFLMNLQDSQKRHFSPDHVSCDSENMGEGYRARLVKNYD